MSSSGSVRRCRRRIRAAAPLLAAVGLVAATAIPAKAASLAPATNATATAAAGQATAARRVANPPKNEPLTKTMVQDCETFPSATLAKCNAASVAGIDAARKKEHVAVIKFPSNYLHLSLAEQLFVVNNLERKARHLTPVPGLNKTLDSLAEQGAKSEGDPEGPSGYTWGSNWGDTIEGALVLDYSLMYDDGRGGNNLNCQRGDYSGCWGHRDNILDSTWTTASEGGDASHVAQRISIDGRRYAVESVASLFVAGYRSRHTLSFRWAAEARLKQVYFSQLK